MTGGPAEDEQVRAAPSGAAADDVLRLALARPPRCGSTRVIALDGPAGSGKTTLAAAVVAAAAAAGLEVGVVHMDDLYAGWSGLDTGGAALTGLLRDLAVGRPASYRRFDWVLDAYAERVPVAPVDLLVVEGVGSVRAEHVALLTAVVWVEEPDRGERLRRGLVRDGEEARPHWVTWMRQEEELFAAVGTRRRADLLVDGVGRAGGGSPRTGVGGQVLDLTGRATDVAPQLLGALLTSAVDGEQVTVRIVEVEAYEGDQDPASHAFRGPSARNAAMFGAAGHLYVYRHLGIHHCVNLVVGREGEPAAVLLRGAQVAEGAATAWRRRLATGACRTERDLARGPGRLAVALGLTRAHDGVPVALGPATGHDLVRLRPPPSPPPEVVSGPRVGIGGSGAEAAGRPWRFWLPADRQVSATR